MNIRKAAVLRKIINLSFLFVGIFTLLFSLAVSLFSNSFINTAGVDIYFFCTGPLFTLGIFELMYGILCTRYCLDHLGVYVLFIVINIGTLYEMTSSLLHTVLPLYRFLLLLQLAAVFAFCWINMKCCVLGKYAKP